MEKKTKKIILSLIGILAIIAVLYFICFYRGTTENNKKSLTIAEEITLNDNEKELLAELINVNNKLQNPETKENANITDYTEIAKPAEPTSLKDFCKKIYEARKTTNEQGETIYLFDMETIGKNQETIRRIFVTKNGEIVGCTFVESDYADSLEQMENTTVNNGGINLGKDFVKVIFDGLTNSINETWEKATVYNDVNYNNIINKI